MNIIDKQTLSGKATAALAQGKSCKHILVDIPLNQFRVYEAFTTNDGKEISGGESIKIGKSDQKVKLVLDGVTYNVFISITKSDSSKSTPVESIF